LYPNIVEVRYRFTLTIYIFIPIGDDCEIDMNPCDANPCAQGQNCTDTLATELDLNATLPEYTCSACPIGYEQMEDKCIGKLQVICL